MLGGEFLQANSSLLKHFLNRALLLENLIHVILTEEESIFNIAAYHVFINSQNEISSSHPELRIEHRLVLTADGAAVRDGVQSCRIQVALQLLQSRLGSILRLTAVHRLVSQQQDPVLTPLGRLQGKCFSALRPDCLIPDVISVAVPSPGRGAAPGP